MAATATTTKQASTEGMGSRLARAVRKGPLHVVLVLIALFWLLPTAGLLVSSFRSASDNAAAGWWSVLTAPAQLTIDSYRSLIEDPGMVDAFWNTLLITVPATIGVVLVGSLAAYAFAWVDFPGRDWAFIGVVGLLVVPLQVALIPVAGLFGQLGIFGSIFGVVLFHVAFGLPFAIFLLRNFFAGIPKELLEAARIDGASEVSIFFRVVLPIGLPAIASLSIFQFLWVWNDLLVGLVFAGADATPLTVAIREQTRQFGANIDVIAPGAFISLVVPLIVFFAFQRYFVQGLLAGAEK
ncbi:MAG TPA: carbohydrate ABC transporter permease [Acidimicrobiales bacterium]|nr:carbohydrate ABC transporter permease [Acidimicrobiales bacterium]